MYNLGKINGKEIISISGIMAMASDGSQFNLLFDRLNKSTSKNKARKKQNVSKPISGSVEKPAEKIVKNFKKDRIPPVVTKIKEIIPQKEEKRPKKVIAPEIKKIVQKESDNDIFSKAMHWGGDIKQLS